jgi:hypothetical protein
MQVAANDGFGFDYCHPVTFTQVRATEHLTHAQAVALAQGSVHKMFRLADVDASGAGPIQIPGYGPLVRRQQIHLLPGMVEQVVPELPDPRFGRNDHLLNPDAQRAEGQLQLEDFIRDRYDGYARDIPAKAYGSFFQNTSGVTYLRAVNGNTPPTQEIHIPFSIDPIYQTITFQQPVYRYANDQRIVPANVTLETGCHVRDANTNQFARFVLSRQLRQGATLSFFETEKHEDVQLGIIGQYDFVPSNSRLVGSGLNQIVRITFHEEELDSKMPAGVVFNVTVGANTYTYTTSLNDTPLIVATWFKNNIPDTADYTVTLLSADPGSLAVPHQLAPALLRGGFNHGGPQYYAVTATTLLGETTVSNEQSMTFTSATDRKIAISWREVPHATGYRVWNGSVPGVYDRRIGEAVAWQRQVVFTNADWEDESPPVVNTAAIPLRNASIQIEGVNNGFAFDVAADVEPVDLQGNESVTGEFLQFAQEDMQDYNSRLTGATILEADPIFRANYYLDGMMKKYQVKAAQTVEYNQILPISLDGAVSQVTWQVGGGSPVRTTASLNCEHATFVPPYPARRRAENMAGVLPERRQNVIVEQQQEAE